MSLSIGVKFYNTHPDHGVSVILFSYEKQGRFPDSGVFRELKRADVLAEAGRRFEAVLAEGDEERADRVRARVADHPSPVRRRRRFGRLSEVDFTFEDKVDVLAGFFRPLKNFQGHLGKIRKQCKDQMKYA